MSYQSYSNVPPTPPLNTDQTYQSVPIVHSHSENILVHPFHDGDMEKEKQTYTVEESTPFTSQPNHLHPLPRTLSLFDWLLPLLAIVLASAASIALARLTEVGVPGADIIAKPPKSWTKGWAYTTQGFMVKDRVVVLPTITVLMILVPWLFAGCVEARLRLELYVRLRRAKEPDTKLLESLWRAATGSVSTVANTPTGPAQNPYKSLHARLALHRKTESLTYYLLSALFAILITNFVIIEADGLSSASAQGRILFRNTGYNSSTCLSGDWAGRAVNNSISTVQAGDTDKERDANADKVYLPLVYALKEAQPGLDHPFVVAGLGDGMSIWQDATISETSTWGESGWFVACSETECYAYFAANGTNPQTVNRNPLNVTRVREAFFQLAALDPVLLALSQYGSEEQDEQVFGALLNSTEAISGKRKPGVTYRIATGILASQSSNTYRTAYLISRACAVPLSSVKSLLPPKATGIPSLISVNYHPKSTVTVLLPAKINFFPAFVPVILILIVAIAGTIAAAPYVLLGVYGYKWGKGEESREEEERRWRVVASLTSDGALGVLSAGGVGAVGATAEGKLIVFE
ncbi:hypothetical protein HDV00_004870 [Rhizophlyctis rosea]|nr:hypothetical protein HDV00_004870 [Rhizophlyctis rosea]